MLPEGQVELVMGTMASGQGHETSFAQLVTEWLGVPFDSIDYVAHDTDAGDGRRRLAFRPLDEAGRRRSSARRPTTIIDKGRKIASYLLEAGEVDIEFEGGRFRVAGTDREIGLFEVAAAATARPDLPEELQGPLAGISDQTLPVASFPYGTQVCEVEVDAETGAVEIVGYAAVDDVGRAINPMILHGQTHGGIAQGVGQALLEHCALRPASGQLLSASFMDYAMPRADTFPLLKTALSEVPSPTNRLGVRSGGEGGTTPALAAVDQRDRRCACPNLAFATSKCRRPRSASGARSRQRRAAQRRIAGLVGSSRSWAEAMICLGGGRRSFVRTLSPRPQPSPLARADERAGLVDSSVAESHHATSNAMGSR